MLIRPGTIDNLSAICWHASARDMCANRFSDIARAAIV